MPTGRLRSSPGESFSLYYRVILHAGDATAAGIADAYARYAQEPVESLTTRRLRMHRRCPRMSRMKQIAKARPIREGFPARSNPYMFRDEN